MRKSDERVTDSLQAAGDAGTEAGAGAEAEARRQRTAEPDTQVPIAASTVPIAGAGNPTPTSARDRAPSPPISTGSASSDPLSPLLGPLPAPTVKPRGRGAFTGSSGAIDAHFAASYDPGTDVSPRLGDPDADDWDLALEALRDRQRWKAQGADRLRAAGFSEDEVRKWEGGKGGVNGERERERDEKDV
ncbi:hypothetical protein LTR04_001537, partial [Oleoguttula sp. CCFEE 6159]